LSDATQPSAVGWSAWSPIAAMFFVNGAVYGVWATQIPLAKQRLALDTSVLGAAIFLIGAGAIVAMAASGWILQRIGSSALIRISAVIFLALLPLACIAPAVQTLALILFFFGASGGSMDVAMNVAASDAEKRARRPWMSSFHGMWSLGGLAGASLATVLEGLLGGALQGLIMAAILAAIFAIGQRGLLRVRQSTTPASTQWRALRPSLLAILVGVMAGLCFAGEGAVLDWAAIYLRDSLGWATERANAGYAAFSGAMAVGRISGDFLRRSMSGVALVRSGCLIGIVGLLAGPVTGDPLAAVAGYALAGLGFSNIVPVLFSTAGAMPHPETQIAAVSTLGYAGLLAAPPLLGFVGQAASLAGIFYVTAAALIVIAALGGLCGSARQIETSLQS
jgi:predicted MFS family arabinose efflux permease